MDRVHHLIFIDNVMYSKLLRGRRISKADGLPVPWHQSKINEFNATLAELDDEKVLKLEREFRNYSQSWDVILENEDRLYSGLEAILPGERATTYFPCITLFVNLYNGTRPGLLAEIKKRGLTIA